VNDNSPPTAGGVVGDYARGYQDGYNKGFNDHAARQRDLYKLNQRTADPRTSMLTASVLLVFGGLLLLADIVGFVRMGEFDALAALCAAVPLTIAFFILRDRPKVKLRAAQAKADYNQRWGTSGAFSQSKRGLPNPHQDNAPARVLLLASQASDWRLHPAPLLIRQ
jgi:hypothetical protein